MDNPAAAPLASLPTLDVGSLPAIFEAEQTRTATATVKGDRVYRRVASARRLVRHEGHVARMVQLVDPLPAPGETLHAVTSGGLPMVTLVDAVLELAAPATISRLSLVTLGYSREAIPQLAAHLDSRAIAAVDVVLSNYFRSVDAELYSDLHSMLTTRGQRIAAARVHHKVLAFELSDGTALTCEGSGNLRSCKSGEQFTLTNDAGLLAFHQTWISELLETAIRQGG